MITGPQGHSVVIGGHENQGGGIAGVIVGGLGNTNRGQWSTVIGGRENSIPLTLTGTLNGQADVILGGVQQEANQRYQVLLGEP